jgi:ABC-2 type transport system permease protein
VHPGLWLLVRLRLRGWARRLYRGANTVRGVLLLVVGCLVFVAWVAPLFVQTALAPPQDLDEVRRWGPLVLLGFWLLNFVFSSSEGAIAFTPAEVNLLFPAPLSRRQLLAYKVFLYFASSFVSSLFMALFLRRYSSSYLATVVALTLCMFFLQSFTTFLSLLASTIGARAYNLQRRIVLGFLIVAVVLVAVRGFVTYAPADWRDWLEVFDQSWLAQVVLAPLRWFVLAMTAERLWPDLVQWTALSLLVNLVCLAVVFLMDAQYLEASAAASEKLYARLQRARRGGPLAVGSPGSGRARLRLPVFPSWGGVGPIVWRQMSTALRGIWTVLIVLVVTTAMSIPVWFESPGTEPSPLWVRLIGLLVGMTLFLPMMLPFDFRGDIDRMDMLKILPLPSWRLVVGQLLTPILLMSLVQSLVLIAAQVSHGETDPAFLPVLAFAVPINAVMFGLENLLFLLFPTRVLGASPGDIQALGRQVVLAIVKVFALMTLGGLAAAAGLLSYFLAGQSPAAALAAAWLVLAAFAAGLVPLVGLAFRRFDVSHDTPP